MKKDSMEIRKEMKWVKYPDEKPEPFVDVLCYCVPIVTVVFNADERYCAVDRYCIWNDGEEAGFRTERFRYGTVTHWMTLPEKPEKQEE